MKEVRLDLFKLHDENDKGQGKIKVELNPQLINQLNELIREIQAKKKIKLKEIAKIINLSSQDLYRRSNKRCFPLESIEKLISLWSNITHKNYEKKKWEIQENIKWLTYGAGNTYKKVKAPKSLNKNLCRICGAIIADGNLNNSNFKNKFPKFIIDIKDQYKENLDAFSLWIINEFNVKTCAKKDKKNNLWRISFANKIIYRYLNKIFQIPAGKKSEIARMPDIIKRNNLDFHIAFANGVLLFDGGVGKKTTYFNLSTKSKFLIEDIKRTLEKIHIKPDYVSQGIVPSTGVYELRIWNKDKLKKILNDFLEVGTSKYNQLKNQLIFKNRNLI